MIGNTIGSSTVPDYQALSSRLLCIHEAVDEEQTLHGIITFALSSLECDMGGVMLKSRGHLETAGATQPLVNRADQLQMSLAEGPCMSALRASHNFCIDDTSTDPRWPRWGPAAAELGIRSVLSIRMADLDKPTIGSVNLYARRTAAFGPDSLEIAAILGRHATAAYLKARRHSAADRAIETRSTIGQAQGILMERFAIDADQAFSVLRRYSQAENVPLTLVASRLVEERQLPPTTA
jgi:GAF domain-containing protein